MNASTRKRAHKHPLAFKGLCCSTPQVPPGICKNMECSNPDGSNVPSDVWWRIMSECGPYELRALSKCSRMFYNLAKSRTIWLKCVQNLDPHEPPSIPKHVSPLSLATTELRNLAIEAHRRTLDCESDTPPKITREVIISLKDANPDEVLGEPVEFGLQLFLLPGGDYLLIYWPAGYLQCWSVREKSCLWVYPDLPEGASEDRPKLLWSFDFDIQENGGVHLLLIDERLQGEEMGDMYSNIVRFSSETTSLEKLHFEQQFNREFGSPILTRLRGNLVMMYQQRWGSPNGTLTILFRDENEYLIVADINVECLEIADDYIVCLSLLADGNRSLNLFSLADLLEAAQRTSNGFKKTIPGADVLYASILLEPKSFGQRKAQLSVNTLHWKNPIDRDKIYITVLYKDKISKGTPFARFILNKAGKNSNGGSLPLLCSLPVDDDDDAPLRLSGQNTVSYSTLTPPTLSGQSLVLLHSSNLDNESDDRTALATLTLEGKMNFRPLDLGVDHNGVQSLCTEFYSGAVLFATKDYSSVVIRYFE